MKKENRLFAFFGLNRYGRAGTVAWAVALCTLALLITANALLGLLPYRISNPDVTGSSTFRISGTTKDYLSTLDEDVTLYLINAGGKNAVDGDLYGFLCQYRESSAHVRVEIVDPEEQTDFIKAYGGTWPSDKSLIVQGAKRYRIIEQSDLYYYYNATLERKLSPTEYAEILNAAFSTEDATLAAQYQQILAATTAYFDGESRVANAINFVTRERVPIVYSYLGAGCTEPESALRALLADACYDVRTTMSIASLPADCGVLMLHAPAADLAESEATALRAYLASGGKLILATPLQRASKLPHLSSILDEYGMRAAEGEHILMEGRAQNLLGDTQSTYPYLFYAQINKAHALTEGFSKSFVACYPQAISLSEREGVTVTRLLHTSAEGYLYSYDVTQNKWEISEEKAEYVFGAVAEKGNSTVIWLSCADSLSATANAFAEDNGNYLLILQMMNRLSGFEVSAISVESKLFESTDISVSVGQFMILGILIALILPVAAVTVGVIVWQTRKKR